MAGYIYNPGESIRRDFQQTQAGLGEIFAQIIQQQQRDYTLAENTFANIEALKKDVNIYGQKSITDKANNLLSYTSNSILKDGKLDYSKVGEVRRAVSDIKDLKIGYDLAAKEYEKALQLGVGSKDDLLSFQKYYSDLGALMNNENLIKNPRDLQVAFSKAYTNNLNGDKKFVDVFKSIAPYSPIEKQITNSKGGITDIKGEVPRGWEIDENSKVSYPKTITITNPDGTTKEIPYITQITAELNAKDPTLIPLLRAQGGVGASKLSDEELVGYHLNNTVKVGASAKETKTKAQLDMEASRAKNEGIQANYAEEVIKAELAAKNASTQASRAQTAYYGAQTDLLNNPGNDYFYDENGRPRLNFGSHSPKIDLPLFGTNKVQKVAVSEIGYDKSGKPYISYYVPKAGESVDDMIKNNMASGIRKTATLPANIASSETFYNMTKGLVGKDKARTLNLLKQFPNITPRVSSTAALPGTGKFIAKSKLSSMYGPGKQYKSESEAAEAAKELGYTVEGY